MRRKLFNGYVNLPNLLTWLRLFLAPILVAAAVGGRPICFLMLVALSFMTDSMDGFFARRFNQTSAYGARLDSWADLAMILALTSGVWCLYPGFLREEFTYVAVALLGYGVPFVVGLLKHRLVLSFHTLGDRVSAVLLGVSGAVYLLGGGTWLFHCAVIFLAVAQAEKLIMTLVLPAWRCDVCSLTQALNLRRDGLAAGFGGEPKALCAEHQDGSA